MDGVLLAADIVLFYALLVLICVQSEGRCDDTRCDHRKWVRRFGREIGWSIHGNVEIGEGVRLCAPLDINGKDSRITIGAGADLAGFVTVTTADSHLRCIGLSDKMARAEVNIGPCVFVGQGATILGGTHIGPRSVVGAGTVVSGLPIPADSLVHPEDCVVREGYYVSYA